MIKIKLKKNLAYLFTYFIFAIISDITAIIVSSKINMNIFIYLLSIGNFIGGLSLFLYQKNSMEKYGITKYFQIKTKKKMIIGDGTFKKLILIFLASYFDIYKYILNNSNYVAIPSPKYLGLSSMHLISSSLISAYSLGFEIKKHHKISLIFISLLLLLTIIFYLVFDNYHNLGKTISIYLIFLYYWIISSFNNCIQKYLVDTNYMNPFVILMIGGIFELIFALFLTIRNNPFIELKNKWKSYTSGEKILVIFLLVFRFIFEIIVNVYKIYCNVVYTPMLRSLIHFFLNPLFYIGYFFLGLEFNHNIIYFIINEIISLFISFFGCFFNELIILFCCGLEFETQDVIANRAIESENISNMNKNTLIAELDDNSSSGNNNVDKDSEVESSNNVSFENYKVEV